MRKILLFLPLLALAFTPPGINNYESVSSHWKDKTNDMITQEEEKIKNKISNGGIEVENEDAKEVYSSSTDLKTLEEKRYQLLVSQYKTVRKIKEIKKRQYLLRAEILHYLKKTKLIKEKEIDLLLAKLSYEISKTLINELYYAYKKGKIKEEEFFAISDLIFSVFVF